VHQAKLYLIEFEMKPILKYLFFLVLSLSLFGCTKEVARKFYILQLHFDNGMEHESEGRIFEKDKVYKSDDPEDIDNSVTMHYLPNSIKYFSKNELTIILFKTKEKQLVGATNSVESLTVKNASAIIGLESSKLEGILELEGSYKSPFRKITVENGTFSFTWSNAEDYGLQDTVLTGTWSLKRK
jgi:hypothetical protein